MNLSEEQKKALTNILVKYFNGQASIAAEAGTIQQLINVINAKEKKEEPKKKNK